MKYKYSKIRAQRFQTQTRDEIFYPLTPCERCKRHLNNLGDIGATVWMGVTKSGRHFCHDCLVWLESNDPDFALGAEASEV